MYALIGVEYGGAGGGAEGLEAHPEILQGGSAPAEILLNLIAVTIPANPKAFHDAKKGQHSDIVNLFYS